MPECDGAHLRHLLTFCCHFRNTPVHTKYTPSVSWAQTGVDIICARSVEWRAVAATHHSLNGLIISANPASFPPSLSLSISPQSLFLSSDRTADGREAPLPFKFQTRRRHRRPPQDAQDGKKRGAGEGGRLGRGWEWGMGGDKKSVSSDVKSFNFYRAIRGFITAEPCQDSLRLSDG